MPEASVPPRPSQPPEEASSRSPALPPGQKARADFPPFGHPSFARRLARVELRDGLEIGGDVRWSVRLGVEELAALPRLEQVSDFHCVTTWSYRGARWGGVRLRDLYRMVVEPRAQPDRGIALVVFRGLDGYSTGLPLDDVLADDVLVADRLDGQALPLAHGAPLRIVAPQHYGYKNVKHLASIELLRDPKAFRPVLALLDHPRARVAFEERGPHLPGWLLRRVYRPFVGTSARQFDRALRSLAQAPVSRQSGER